MPIEVWKQNQVPDSEVACLEDRPSLASGRYHLLMDGSAICAAGRKTGLLGPRVLNGCLNGWGVRVLNSSLRPRRLVATEAAKGAIFLNQTWNRVSVSTFQHQGEQTTSGNICERKATAPCYIYIYAEWRRDFRAKPKRPCHDNQHPFFTATPQT